MDFIEIIGFAAAVFTTISGLPQFIKTVHTKNTQSLSLYTFIILFIGVFLWFMYGIMIKSIPLALSNGVALIPILIMIVLKIRHK